MSYVPYTTTCANTAAQNLLGRARMAGLADVTSGFAAVGVLRFLGEMLRRASPGAHSTSTSTCTCTRAVSLRGTSPSYPACQTPPCLPACILPCLHPVLSIFYPPNLSSLPSNTQSPSNAAPFLLAACAPAPKVYTPASPCKNKQRHPPQSPTPPPIVRCDRSPERCAAA